jgi:hypothetical protein
MTAKLDAMAPVARELGLNQLATRLLGQASQGA